MFPWQNSAGDTVHVADTARPARCGGDVRAYFEVRPRKHVLEKIGTLSAHASIFQPLYIFIAYFITLRHQKIILTTTSFFSKGRKFRFRSTATTLLFHLKKFLLPCLPTTANFHWGKVSP